MTDGDIERLVFELEAARREIGTLKRRAAKKGRPTRGPRGFELVARPDPARRRGLWIKRLRHSIVLRAGREGGDAEFVLREGEVVTRADLGDLADCMDTLRAAHTSGLGVARLV